MFVEDVFVEVVLLACPFEKQRQWHLHVFKFVHWCFEVEIANIKAAVSCSFSTDDAVPYYLGGGNVCCPCCQFAWAFDQVAACCDSDSVGVRLLWSDINYNACIRRVLLSPWVVRPFSFPNPVCHVPRTSGSESRASFLYCVMVSPVLGCTIAAQKCPMSTSWKLSCVARCVGL